ncbi:sucrase ferredoxin [Antrihabitans stalactiti]|uniref:Sucrase ferredoxin n=1 Tax=Antrihabitans stalactiti TaxID=2584121 RepID=A0A848KD01_9NOCA|nr:sucrase ferredoxin [Antrihabitans stalactiti]NMN96189.1 sucrase ferredoxin [Antrihabitans stalactiti]
MTCSAASAIDEPLPGTAANVTSWLCVEHPGAWGRDVLGDSVLGVELSAELAARTAAAGVRLMLIRRPGRTYLSRPRTVLLANSVPGNTWCEQVAIDELDELLDIDLSRLSGAAPGIGAAVEGPVVLVCAHGKRDQCCALFGRPIAARLAATFPDVVWECSHTGGHRFAPSMIVLPTGYTYGRLDGDRSETVVAAALAGRVSSDGLRGRSSYGAAAQAAEVAVREQVDAGVDDLTVTDSDGLPVVVHRDGRRWESAVRIATLPPRPASCGAVAKPVDTVTVTVRAATT